MGRNFLAQGLTQREWNIVADAKREAEKRAGKDLLNKEFLVEICNRTVKA